MRCTSRWRALRRGSFGAVLKSWMATSMSSMITTDLSGVEPSNLGLKQVLGHCQVQGAPATTYSVTSSTADSVTTHTSRSSSLAMQWISVVLPDPGTPYCQTCQSLNEPCWMTTHEEITTSIRQRVLLVPLLALRTQKVAHILKRAGFDLVVQDKCINGSSSQHAPVLPISLPVVPLEQKNSGQNIEGYLRNAAYALECVQTCRPSRDCLYSL